MSYFKFNQWDGTGIPEAKKNLKPRFKYGWVSYSDPWRPRGKIHRYRTRDKYMCGHYSDNHDKNFNKLKKDMIIEDNMCKRCFANWIIYPDESLPEELFTI